MSGLELFLVSPVPSRPSSPQPVTDVECTSQIESLNDTDVFYSADHAVIDAALVKSATVPSSHGTESLRETEAQSTTHQQSTDALHVQSVSAPSSSRGNSSRENAVSPITDHFPSDASPGPGVTAPERQPASGTDSTLNTTHISMHTKPAPLDTLQLIHADIPPNLPKPQNNGQRDCEKSDNDNEGGAGLELGAGEKSRKRPLGIRSQVNKSTEGLQSTRVVDWILGRHLSENISESIQDPEHQAHGPEWVECEDFYDVEDVNDICPACMTSYCQAIDSIPFKSSLRLSYNDPDVQLWSIGRNLIFHESIDDHPEELESPIVQAMRILARRSATGVPVPKIVTSWKEDGKIMTISERVEGERLYDKWWKLSSKERTNIARQVARSIDEWRQLEAASMSSLSNGPIYTQPNMLGELGPFNSDWQFWQAIRRRLRRKGIDSDMIQFLEGHMPRSNPYVFTHGDLSTMKIMVRGNTVTAIMGLENAAFMPVWAEHVAMHFCHCQEDEQWKAMLFKEMQGRYPDALDWWSLWSAVEDTFATNSTVVKILKERLGRWPKTEISRAQPDPESEDDCELLRHSYRRYNEDEISVSKENTDREPYGHTVPTPSGVLLEMKSYRETSDEDVSNESTCERSTVDGAILIDEEAQEKYLQQIGFDKEQRALTVTSGTYVSSRPSSFINTTKLQGNPLSSTRPMNTAGDDSELASESHQAESSGAPEPTSKTNGLRPYSLVQESRDVRAEQSEEMDASASRDENHAMAYNKLSSIQEDDNPRLNDCADERSSHSAYNQSRLSQQSKSNNGSKRKSMLTNKVAPGAFYRYVANRGSIDAKPGQHNRSHSEVRRGSRHDSKPGKKPRPQSMLPPSSTSFHQEKPGNLETEEGSANQSDLCVTEIITAPAVKKHSYDMSNIDYSQYTTFTDRK
ncbi:hypothetical protein F5Y18DRAFT_440200 [Xylariaceae sp. FL1019]|nr:hypothetical protein F5Y18DRAFT_440200 [Xylariaceae sp. FL1019]